MLAIVQFNYKNKEGNVVQETLATFSGDKS